MAPLRRRRRPRHRPREGPRRARPHAVSPPRAPGGQWPLRTPRGHRESSGPSEPPRGHGAGTGPSEPPEGTGWAPGGHRALRAPRGHRAGTGRAPGTQSGSRALAARGAPAARSTPSTVRPRSDRPGRGHGAGAAAHSGSLGAARSVLPVAQLTSGQQRAKIRTNQS